MLTFVLLGTLVLLYGFCTLWKRMEFCKILSEIPGPKPWPLVGNSLQLKRNSHEFYLQLMGWFNEYQQHGFFCVWLGTKPVIAVFKPEYVEELLSNQKNITKSIVYTALHPWLGTGLLTSTGSKWKNRRRLLTPAFHFKILNDFIPVYKKQADILIHILKGKAGKGQFDIAPYITLCVLDVICESAMGVNINSQLDSSSKYAEAIWRIVELVQERQKSPWLWFDLIYDMTLSGRKHQDTLKILHGFTNKVIDDRIYQKKQDHDKTPQKQIVLDDFPMYSSRKRHFRAFLDLLLEEYDKGNITKEGVREEVDTFMFEGHDTTAASLQWVVHLLGLHPDVQQKLQNEVDNFYESINETINPDQLKNLNYLECVVKEALRLWPSVPLFGREVTEEFQLGNYCVPKGCEIVVASMALHMNPDVWEEPEIFNPDRFLIENSSSRHPFAYVPFSAGSRNCIGQRFAMMEEKIVLSSIVRHFNIKSTQETKDMCISTELIMKSTDGIIVELSLRNTHSA